ncbi:MAG: hypothetical protein KatS3mg065_0954 [Chloroflexota bacterium]|nr:MAG: hypothetical protein KatS3mg065_0954 [Chloroflexota bacterium]
MSLHDHEALVWLLHREREALVQELARERDFRRGACDRDAGDDRRSGEGTTSVRLRARLGHVFVRIGHGFLDGAGSGPSVGCQADGSRRGSTGRPSDRTAPIPPRTS